MLLYYITDRLQLGDTESTRIPRLLERIEAAARAGVDFIQLRERDLSSRELDRLACEAVAAVGAAKTSAKLMINSRVDVALSAGADGVHLRSDDISASEARAVWAKSAQSAQCIVGVSCHTLPDVLSAESHGAEFAVFGPVFGKAGSQAAPIGMEGIAKVTRRSGAPDPKVEAGQALRMPVLALGGVTIGNAEDCIRAGVAGVAGIRLFQEGNVETTVRRLRSLGVSSYSGKSS